MMLKSVSFVWVLWLVLACNNSADRQQQNNEIAGQQDTTAATTNETEKKNILFFGNSLTAGMGLDDQSEAFPGVLQQRIDSLGLPYRVINGGLSGETSAGGKERIDWLLNEEIAVFVLELGANDGLRGIRPELTKENLQGIIDKVNDRYPECKLVLTGMMVPPNMGGEYGQAFTAIFPALAEENEMAFVPFLLEGVAGEPKLNQSDGIHPTAEGHQILADNVWEVLAPLLQ